MNIFYEAILFARTSEQRRIEFSAQGFIFKKIESECLIKNRLAQYDVLGKFLNLNLLETNKFYSFFATCFWM